MPEAGICGAPPSGPVSIRRAGPADAARVGELFDAYRQFYGRPADPVTAGKFLRQRLDRDESVLLVAETATSAVGFLQLYPSFDSVEAAPVWILHDLFVTPAFRRRGVGRLLMDAARELAESTGACGLSLATAVDNLAAQALYEGLGYKRDRRFLHYFLSVRR